MDDPLLGGSDKKVHFPILHILLTFRGGGLLIRGWHYTSNKQDYYLDLLILEKQVVICCNNARPFDSGKQVVICCNNARPFESGKKQVAICCNNARPFVQHNLDIFGLEMEWIVLGLASWLPKPDRLLKPSLPQASPIRRTGGFDHCYLCYHRASICIGGHGAKPPRNLCEAECDPERVRVTVRNKKNDLGISLMLRISDDVFRMVQFEIVEANLAKHQTYLEAHLLCHQYSSNQSPIV